MYLARCREEGEVRCNDRELFKKGLEVCCKRDEGGECKKRKISYCNCACDRERECK